MPHQMGPRVRQPVDLDGPSPGEQMRELLAARRRVRTPFRIAWKEAMRSIDWPEPAAEREGWQVALRGTRKEWQRAYERERVMEHGSVLALEGSGTPLLEGVGV
jgi:hypothetical protein